MFILHPVSENIQDTLENEICGKSFAIWLLSHYFCRRFLKLVSFTVKISE